MKKAFTIVAASVLALGAAACHKSADSNSSNVSAEDNMLVPADENSMGADAGNDMGATADNGLATDNSAMAGDNSSNMMAGNTQ